MSEIQDILQLNRWKALGKVTFLSKPEIQTHYRETPIQMTAYFSPENKTKHQNILQQYFQNTESNNCQPQHPIQQKYLWKKGNRKDSVKFKRSSKKTVTT